MLNSLTSNQHIARGELGRIDRHHDGTETQAERRPRRATLSQDLARYRINWEYRRYEAALTEHAHLEAPSQVEY
jgi:hypothetical protein